MNPEETRKELKAVARRCKDLLGDLGGRSNYEVILLTEVVIALGLLWLDMKEAEEKATQAAKPHCRRCDASEGLRRHGGNGQLYCPACWDTYFTAHIGSDHTI